MINREMLEGNWNQLKGYLQQKWGQLTDNDLAQFHGSVDELIGIIQQKTGEGRQTVESFLQGLTASAGSLAGQTAEAARQTAHCATDRLSQGAAEARCWVRDRPCQALAVCFGLGLAVGLVMALKRHCK